MSKKTANCDLTAKKRFFDPKLALANPFPTNFRPCFGQFFCSFLLQGNRKIRPAAWMNKNSLKGGEGWKKRLLAGCTGGVKFSKQRSGLDSPTHRGKSPGKELVGKRLDPATHHPLGKLLPWGRGAQIWGRVGFPMNSWQVLRQPISHFSFFFFVGVLKRTSTMFVKTTILDFQNPNRAMWCGAPGRQGRSWDFDNRGASQVSHGT